MKELNDWCVLLVTCFFCSRNSCVCVCVCVYRRPCLGWLDRHLVIPRRGRLHCLGLLENEPDSFSITYCKIDESPVSTQRKKSPLTTCFFSSERCCCSGVFHYHQSILTVFWRHLETKRALVRACVLPVHFLSPSVERIVVSVACACLRVISSKISVY